MLLVSIALYGCKVPNSRKDEDKERRNTIFEIAAPYPRFVIGFVYQFAERRDFLQVNVFSQGSFRKFQTYFPHDGASPMPSSGRSVGLLPGQSWQSILDR